MQQINASKAFFIKLGGQGNWDKECTSQGVIRLGYGSADHSLCKDGKWGKVRELIQKGTQNSGAVTRHVNQIKSFYEADETVIWITFHSDRLWWCFSSQEVIPSDNDTRIRRTVDGWHDSDISGKPLHKILLSGKLLAVQGYRGTICNVDLDYLLHKINGTVEPHVAAAQNAFVGLRDALIPIIQKLAPTDLETLTDLIFRQSGWMRTSVLGGTEKDIDLELQSPVTDERIAVQVKSKSNASIWRKYRERFDSMTGFNRFYYVTHSPDKSLLAAMEEDQPENFEFWNVEKLAEQAVRGGLTGWLLDKAQ